MAPEDLLGAVELVADSGGCASLSPTLALLLLWSGQALPTDGPLCSVWRGVGRF